jgi:hypothetical protein
LDFLGKGSPFQRIKQGSFRVELDSRPRLSEEDQDVSLLKAGFKVVDIDMLNYGMTKVAKGTTVL